MNESLQRLTARTIFYPTLAWNILHGRVLRRRNWWDSIDSQIILGALPFARDVPAMAELGVRGVVNTCEEYVGPTKAYARFGIEQHHMPTIDFTHPKFQDVCQAVEFIEQHAAKSQSIYIHCKAGRARSATVAMCWLIKSQQISAAQAQTWLLDKRPHVNAKLAFRPVVMEFEKKFRQNL